MTNGDNHYSVSEYLLDIPDADPRPVRQQRYRIVTQTGRIVGHKFWLTRAEAQDRAAELNSGEITEVDI